MLISFSLKKILTAFLLLPGLFVSLLFLLSFFLFCFRKKIKNMSWYFPLLLAFILWFFSLFPLNSFFMRHLEYGEYNLFGRLPLPIESSSLESHLQEASENAQVIVVLAGGNYDNVPHLEKERLLNNENPGVLKSSFKGGSRPSEDGLYRLTEAFRLWSHIKKEKNKKLAFILSGGNGDKSKGIDSEAFVMKTYLLDFGVPEELIILDEKSHDTYENYLNVRQLMLENAWKNMILVTSAYHMKRCLMLFASEEASSFFSLYPYPVGFLTRPWEFTGPSSFSQIGILNWIPRDFSYLRLSFKEFLGMMAYSRMGY